MVKRLGGRIVLWRPMQSRPHSRCRLVLAHLEHAAGCLDLGADAPPRNECTRERRIGEVDRDRSFSTARVPEGVISRPSEPSPSRRNLCTSFYHSVFCALLYSHPLLPIRCAAAAVLKPPQWCFAAPHHIGGLMPSFST
jgi:hypothetical protein